MASEKLTAFEAIVFAEGIDQQLDAWEETAPQGVAAMGGRDAFAQRLETASIYLSPVPRLNAEEWERMSNEFEQGREHGSANHGQ